MRPAGVGGGCWRGPRHCDGGAAVLQAVACLGAAWPTAAEERPMVTMPGCSVSRQYLHKCRVPAYRQRFPSVRGTGDECPRRGPCPRLLLRRLHLEDRLRMPELCEAAGGGLGVGRPDRPLPPLRASCGRAERSARFWRSGAERFWESTAGRRLANGGCQPVAGRRRPPIRGNRSSRREAGGG